MPLDRIRISSLIAGLTGGRISRNVLGMLSLRIAQLILEFITGVFLARILGASEYGAYAFAMSWVALLGIPAALGFDRLLIREIAVFQARREWASMRGILRRSTQFSLAASLLLSLAAAILIPLLSGGLDEHMRRALYVALLIVPLLAAARVRQAVLQGLGRVALGQLPETFLYPVAFLALLIFLDAASSIELSGYVAVASNGAAAFLACLVGLWLLRRALPKELDNAQPEYRSLSWIKSALPFVWMLGMNVVLMYANIVLLGYLTGSEAVGVFKVASSLAALVAFPSTAVNLALAPTIAHLFALGDFAGLQRHATTSARAVLLMSLPIFAVFVLYGDSVLLLFGSEFVSGNLALTVMSFGYVINIFAGASGYLLIMTKHERTAAILFTIGAALSVVLGYALIPLWGLDGAAVAMAISIGLVSAAFIFQVHRKLRIRSVAFPFGQLHDNNRQDARLIG